MRKSNRVRVDHEKKSDGVRVHQRKERQGEISLSEIEHWGES